MKKIFSYVFSLAIIVILCVPVFAEPDSYNYIWDYADVLSESEEEKLENTLTNIYDEYSIPLLIVSKYGSAQYSATEYAEQIESNNKNYFADYGNSNGFIFVDDFDNNTYILYCVGDADLIIGERECDVIYGIYDDYYEEDNIAEAYEKTAEAVGKYCSIQTDRFIILYVHLVDKVT